MTHPGFMMGGATLHLGVYFFNFAPGLKLLLWGCQENRWSHFYELKKVSRYVKYCLKPSVSLSQALSTGT
jgi:hypothetical protein